MKITLDWNEREPENATNSLQHITKLIEQGFTSGELCELEVDENGKEEELRGWWKIERE